MSNNTPQQTFSEFNGGTLPNSSFQIELERRISILAVESATIRENVRNTDKTLARVETSQAQMAVQLAEIHTSLVKLNAFNDASIHSVNKLIEDKLTPVKIELQTLREQAARLKTTINVVWVIGSAVWIAFLAFKDYFLK